MTWPALGLSLCVLIPSGLAHAQAAPERFGQITGVVRAEASGAPIVRGIACGELVARSAPNSRMHCSTTDEAGRYHLDSLPTGALRVRVNCSGGTQFNGRELASRIVTLAPGATIEWNIDVSAVGCDQRPMERIHGRMNGLYYNPDFETSWFFADGRINLHATTDFTRSGGWPNMFRSLPRPSYGLGCVQVTFAGTMQGPLYNTGDEMHYAFAIDTIAAARPVSEEECFKVVERFLPSVRSLMHRGGG